MCSNFCATDIKNEYDYIEQMKDINQYKVRRQGRLINSRGYKPEYDYSFGECLGTQ